MSDLVARIADAVEVARATGGNVVELLYSEFSMDQDALALIDSMLAN